MNTNAKPLKAYDIVVAELEGATGNRLKEMESALDAEHARPRHFLSLDNAVLQTSALLQHKLPNQRGYFDMDYAVFVENWPPDEARARPGDSFDGVASDL
ncbi:MULTISPECIES: hypothetical protein [Microbacterium]|uniref:hypothetical protein n=1 Tax=Microbacterium TaxID=33882 RepID=UPI0027807BBA|nr:MULTISPECIES: hypothetical protein [Microbacterium]MDQ1082259.1 hypothetical protein [Microbacterium sp. SORGH_AS_0344]MDQ1168970.1 hypothetical protein [Microbacterium proteolyticum]